MQSVGDKQATVMRSPARIRGDVNEGRARGKRGPFGARTFHCARPHSVYGRS